MKSERGDADGGAFATGRWAESCRSSWWFLRKRFCLFAILGASVAAAAAPNRPLNVVFIVADDLRPSLGCYGDTEVKSPHIDRLAARGMRFDRAYCQYPVCNPSRTSFLTGLRPDTTGILDNEIPVRLKRPDIVLLPQLFREQGYFTANLGKILHAGVNDAGKRVFFRDAKSFVENHDFQATALGRKGEGRNLTGGVLRWCNWLAAEGTDEDQPDGQIATTAIKLIEANKDRPFFIAVGLHKPHDPFHAPKKYFDLYPLDKIKLAGAPLSRVPELGIAVPNAASFAGFTDQERREFRRAYYAGISFADAQVGRILDTLDRLQLWENTIVVFLGDHGYHLGEHGWWNKVTLFELGARVPLIVWAPGAAGMRRSSAGIVELLDLYPTLADLAGLAPTSKLEGQSFGPLLGDPALPGKPAAFTQVTRGQRMGRSLRTDRWRYTEWDGGRAGVELYDHTHDPSELRNLAVDPSLANIRAELKQVLASGGLPAKNR